jgi:hypothetical protein
MDESLDVDDLFGDPASLDLALPAPQPPKGLAQRLDEMRVLGCCQYVEKFFFFYMLPRSLPTDKNAGRLPGLDWAALHTYPRIASVWPFATCCAILPMGNGC